MPAFSKGFEALTHVIDYSDAELIHAPLAVRDGGSISLVLRLNGAKFGLRYAGSFNDALSDRDGLLEVTTFGEPSGGIFVEPKEVRGLTAFISRYEIEFGEFADYFLGKRRRTDLQIEEIRNTFKRAPEQ